MQTRSIDVGGFMPQAETLLARAEKFRTTTLESGAFAWEFENRGPDVAALREAARLGMTGIEVDREFGGLGLGFREKVRVAEILSRSSLGFAFSLLNTQNVAARLAALGNDRHRDAYLSDLLAGRRFGATALTEPGAGSDFAAIATTATRTDGGWVLNGTKAWMTNGAIADVILCYAQTDRDRGRDGIACFVIDGQRDGFEATDPYQLVAGSTIGVAGFSLDGYEAIEDDMIIEPGAGFRQALVGVNGARIYVAAMACAAVRTALAEAVEYGSSRESFGRPIIDHQGLAWSLAGVANRLEAAEALTAVAVDRHTEAVVEADRDGDAGGDPSVRARSTALAAAHAKKFATEMAEPALQTCVQAMGAEGLRGDHAGGRLLSESRVLAYVDGTTEMQTERISRSLGAFYGSGSVQSVSVAALTTPPTSPAEIDEPGDDPELDVDTLPAESDLVAPDVTSDFEVVGEPVDDDPLVDEVETDADTNRDAAPDTDQPGVEVDDAGFDGDDAADDDHLGRRPDDGGLDDGGLDDGGRDDGSPDDGGRIDWTKDPFAPAGQRGGLFDEVPETVSLDAEPETGLVETAMAGAHESSLPDATKTIEFEPTGDVSVAAHGLFGQASPAAQPIGDSISSEPLWGDEPASSSQSLPTEPPKPPGPPSAAEPSLPVDPPMPPGPPSAAEPSLPVDPPMPPGPPSAAEPVLPVDPPMPPPLFGAQADDASAPPPPPPTGPPLSTAPPRPPEFGAAPPTPPPEFQQNPDPAPDRPPVPGDEHRLEDEPEPAPSAPPLPPDSMRHGD